MSGDRPRGRAIPERGEHGDSHDPPLGRVSRCGWGRRAPRTAQRHAEEARAGRPGSRPQDRAPEGRTESSAENGGACVCVRAHACMHVLVCMYVFVRIHLYACVSVFVYVFTCTHVYACTCVCVRVSVYMCMSMCLYVCMCVCVYMCAHTCVCVVFVCCMYVRMVFVCLCARARVCVCVCEWPAAGGRNLWKQQAGHLPALTQGGHSPPRPAQRTPPPGASEPGRALCGRGGAS